MITVTLYTRPDCPLCDEVRHDLAGLAPEYPHTLVEQNILADATLFERFRYLIPVVEVNGGALSYPPHDWHSLRTLLAAAQTHPAP